MGSIKSELIEAFTLKTLKTFFVYQLCILKICFVFNPFQTNTGYINKRYDKNGKDACTYTKNAFPFI